MNLRELVNWHLDNHQRLPELHPDHNETLRKQLRATALNVAKDCPSMRVLRVDQPFYLADGSVRYASGRSFFYTDDNHLTDSGSEFVREIFKDALPHISE